MNAAILVFAILPAGSGCSLVDPVKTEDVVRIEWNGCYDEKGRLAYAQLIWWDVTGDGVRCVGYRMVNKTNHAKYKFSERSVSWRENGVTYRVRGTIDRTTTLASEDPEIRDRERLAQKHRPKLFR